MRQRQAIDDSLGRIARAAPSGSAARRLLRTGACLAIPFALSAVLALFAGENTSAPPQNPARQLTAPIIFTQIPVEPGSCRVPPGDAPESTRGSRIVLFDPHLPAKNVVNLTPEFVTAGRPDVSFDGRRVLFVGKRQSAETLGVWEMKTDGSDLRQIVRLSTDCTEARYLSTIYTIDAKQPEYQICFCNVDTTGVSALYTCRMDGSALKRITFNPAGSSNPYPLSDGRLLFSCRQAADVSTSTTFPSAEGHLDSRGSVLFTTNTDGTDVAVFAGIGEPPVLRTMPCETPDGRVMYVEAAIKGGTESAAGLVAVSRTRSLHSRHVLAFDSKGSYHSPSSLPDGQLLVSYRSDGAASYGIYILDPARDAISALAYDAAEWHDVGAVAVRPRPEPAGRSSVVDETVDYGFLYGLNAYLSDSAQATRIEMGRLKRIAVLQAVRRDNARHGPPTKGADEFLENLFDEQLLGEAPIESDGSFFLKVPARTALRLRTLDVDGNVLQAMRSWMWVMPKEGRGCIGCHEDRELAPPNRHVLALRAPPHPVGVAVDRRAESHREQQAKTGNYPPQDAGRGE